MLDHATPDRTAIVAAARACGASCAGNDDTIAAAVAAGIAAVAKLDHATKLRPGYARTGIWGVLGAAVASAVVKGLMSTQSVRH